MTWNEFYGYCEFGKSYYDLTSWEKKEVIELSNKSVFTNVRFISLIYIVIQGIYLADGFINDIFNSYFGIVYLAGLGIAIAASIGMLLLTSFKKALMNSIQPITFCYYVILTIGMLMCFAASLLLDSQNPTVVLLTYIVLTVCPLYKLIYNIIIFFEVLIGVTGLVIAYGKGINASEILIIYTVIIITFVAINYIRSSFMRGFYHQYKNKQMNKELEKLSTTDFLTSLPNRTALNDFVTVNVNNAALQKKTCGVAMIDIDNFKSFNDYYSHMIGDKCLKQIGEEIKRVSKKYEMNAFRYGGEEFIIIDLNSNIDRMEDISREIVKSVENLKIFRADLDENHQNVTISLGSVVGLLRVPEDYNDYLKIADDNLYKSKKSGKNRYTINEIKRGA